MNTVEKKKLKVILMTINIVFLFFEIQKLKLYIDDLKHVSKIENKRFINVNLAFGINMKLFISESMKGQKIKK